MNLEILRKYTLLFAFGLILGVVSGFAQSSPVYDEDDYDGEYDYNNQYYTNSTAMEDRERKNERYKKSYREEELYNGRYKKHYHDNEYSTGFSVNTYSLNSSSESGSTTAASISLYDSKNSKSHNFRDLGKEQSGTKPKNKDDMFSADGSANPDEEPDTGDGGGGGMEGTPPPPPDEPDVPVNGAVPVLAILGLLLFALKLKLKIA